MHDAAYMARALFHAARGRGRTSPNPMVGDGGPFVILKAATSLDGRIAEKPGIRTQLTSAIANRHVHYGRAEVDAIGIGSGAALADDPELTPRGVYRERPLVRVVFDRR